MPDLKANEVFQDMSFPLRGLDLSSAYGLQRVGTTREGQNVRAQDLAEGRDRGGQRPGLAKFIAGQIPGGASQVQELNFVVRAGGEALLDNFDWTTYGGGILGIDFIVDPSNNPFPLDPRNNGRLIPEGGTATQPSGSSKKTPTIVWTDPDDDIVGDLLDGADLDATAVDPVTGATVTGTFTYTPPIGTVLSSPGENQPLTVNFVPNDTATYKNAAKTVYIDVSGPGIAFVQKKYQSGATSGPPLTTVLAYTSPVTSGSLLVACMVTYNSTGPAGSYATYSISDTAGNSWTSLGKIDFLWVGDISAPQNVEYSMQAWYAIANSTAASTVTMAVTSDPGFGSGDGIILEYSGTHASPLDGNVTNTDPGINGMGSSATTGTVPVNFADSLLLGFIYTLSITSFTPGAGFTDRTGVTNGGLNVLEKLMVGSGAPVTASVVEFINGFGENHSAYMARGTSWRKA